MNNPPDEVLMALDDAASALGVEPDTLARMLLARLITPTATDPDGVTWWRLDHLRHQLAAYLDDHDED